MCLTGLQFFRKENSFLLSQTVFIIKPKKTFEIVLIGNFDFCA